MNIWATSTSQIVRLIISKEKATINIGGVIEIKSGCPNYLWSSLYIWNQHNLLFGQVERIKRIQTLNLLPYGTLANKSHGANLATFSIFISYKSNSLSNSQIRLVYSHHPLVLIKQLSIKIFEISLILTQLKTGIRNPNQLNYMFRLIY